MKRRKVERDREMEVDGRGGEWGRVKCSGGRWSGSGGSFSGSTEGVLVDVKGGGVEGGGVRWMNNAGSPPSFSNLGPANPRK